MNDDEIQITDLSEAWEQLGRYCEQDAVMADRLSNNPATVASIRRVLDANFSALAQRTLTGGGISTRDHTLDSWRHFPQPIHDPYGPVPIPPRPPAPEPVFRSPCRQDDHEFVPRETTPDICKKCGRHAP